MEVPGETWTRGEETRLVFTRLELLILPVVRREGDSEDLRQPRHLHTRAVPHLLALTAPGVLGVVVMTVSPTDSPRRRNRRRILILIR